MTAYRYVVFPPKSAPTGDELDAFRGYAELLENHVAYGKRRGDGGLAIACEAEPFDRLRGLDPPFEELLLKWQVRGGEVVESLPFVKDRRPWKKIKGAKSPEAPAAAEPPPAPSEAPASTPPQAVDGKEAYARGRLRAADISARGQAYQRLGERLPYALWAIAGVAILLVGAHVGRRLAGGEGESRAETVERVSQDPLAERLTPRREAP